MVEEITRARGNVRMFLQQPHGATFQRTALVGSSHGCCPSYPEYSTQVSLGKFQNLDWVDIASFQIIFPSPHNCHLTSLETDGNGKQTSPPPQLRRDLTGLSFTRRFGLKSCSEFMAILEWYWNTDVTILGWYWWGTRAVLIGSSLPSISSFLHTPYISITPHKPGICVPTLTVARSSAVVKALCYKLEGYGFDTRWGEFFQFT
jgi:hypothetical protein